MTTLQPGQQLGPYQVISQIGKGGMATVYKAYHAAVDRYVAIKIISNQLAGNAEFLKRFQQEARLIAKLEHPHILPIHDFGEAEGVPYMVMRYLEAGTLKERLKSNALTLAEIDRLFTQLADALQYAHENGVIHRDIKPSNVMLDKRGAVFLTDFGVAKMLEGSSSLTATGTVTGTPDYMSPEQAQGLKVDARSDVYSLGIVLFEMLTGHVPFEAETPLAVLFKQIQEPPPPLSVIRPDLPYQLEAVLLKALTKNPADRFASIQDFYEAWQRAILTIMQEQPTARLPEAVEFLPPEPEPAAPVASASPTVQTPARKGFPWLGLAAGLLMLVAVAVVFIFLRLGGLRQDQVRLAAQSTLSSLAETRVAFSPTPPPASLPTRALRVATGAEKVTSWAGGNSVLSILPLRDTIYTGGPGGIAEWNPSTGAATQWTMRDGLPASYVSALFLDPKSGVWIGTTSGLVHLTNTARELYTSSDGLDSDYVTGLAWRADQLWVGTQYCGGPGCGLQTLSGTKIEPVKGFPSQEQPDAAHVSHNILFVYVDKQEQVWVGTDNGLALLDRRARWRVFKTANGLPGGRVFSILEDAADTIWVGTDEGGVSKFDSGAGTFKAQFDLRELGIYDVTSMLQSADGHYWFAGYSLAEYNPKTEELTRYSTDDGNFPAYQPVTLAQGPGEVIYIGTLGDGLVRFEKGESVQWTIPNVPGEAGYSQIVPAADGSLYFIEQYWNQVDQFIPSTDKWKNSLAENLSIPRAIDPQGNIYGGAWDGLWIISPNGISQHLTTENGLPSDEIYAVDFDKSGNAWVGTQGGLVTLKGSIIVDVTPGGELGLDGDAVRKVFVDSRGGIWAAGESGGNMAYLPPGGNWTLQAAHLVLGVNPESITDFAEAPNGDILIASYGSGLFTRSPAGEWTRTYIGSAGVTQPIDYLRSLAVGPDGSLWLGLDDRVVRFDGQTWKGFTIKEGLSGLLVYDIYIDLAGSVWFATNGGVTRFAP
jgi:ligand-binding sensor domain-containing protein/tRNA A-37 threonylcarbamoyl transferase component Bud32